MSLHLRREPFHRRRLSIAGGPFSQRPNFYVPPLEHSTRLLKLCHDFSSLFFIIIDVLVTVERPHIFIEEIFQDFCTCRQALKVLLGGADASACRHLVDALHRLPEPVPSILASNVISASLLEFPGTQSHCDGIFPSYCPVKIKRPGAIFTFCSKSGCGTTFARTGPKASSAYGSEGELRHVVHARNVWNI